SAQANPPLSAVMPGGSALGGFSLTDEDRQHGGYTLEAVVGCVQRCMQGGRFRPADAQLIAHQVWSAMHGLVTLELGGYLIEPYTADLCYEAQLVGLMGGAGDSVEAATPSVHDASERPPDKARGPIRGRRDATGTTPEPPPPRGPARPGPPPPGPATP